MVLSKHEETVTQLFILIFRPLLSAHQVCFSKTKRPETWTIIMPERLIQADLFFVAASRLSALFPEPVSAMATPGLPHSKSAVKAWRVYGNSIPKAW